MDGGGPKHQLCALWGARSRESTIIHQVRSMPRAACRARLAAMRGSVALRVRDHVARRRSPRSTRSPSSRSRCLVKIHVFFPSQAATSTSPWEHPKQGPGATSQDGAPLGVRTIHPPSRTKSSDRRDETKKRRPGGGGVGRPRTAPATENFRRLNETFYGGGLRISLGLVDLSRIQSGTFFREVHPGSEMASQNDQNKAK